MCVRADLRTNAFVIYCLFGFRKCRQGGVCVCWATGCIFDGWFSHEFSLIPYFLPNRMNICGFVIFIQQSHIGHSHSLSSEGLGAFQEFMEQNPIDTNSPYYDAMPTLICREFASFCFMCLGCFGALSRFFV